MILRLGLLQVSAASARGWNPFSFRKAAHCLLLATSFIPPGHLLTVYKLQATCFFLFPSAFLRRTFQRRSRGKRVVSCGDLTSVSGSFSMNVVFIFLVELCLWWDGRPMIVQRKRIYTWRLERARAGGSPGFFDVSTFSSGDSAWILGLLFTGTSVSSPLPCSAPVFLLSLILLLPVQQRRYIF